MRTTLAIQGWQRIGLNESALIESLVSGWENSPVGENAEKRSEHEAYAKSIAGRTALLLIKDYDTPHSGSIARWTTCDLFDFAEAPSLNDLHAVLGEQRVEAQHEPYFPDATADSLVGISWHEPYALEGSTITNVKTVPAEYYGVSFVNYSSVKWFDREPPGDLQWPSPPVHSSTASTTAAATVNFHPNRPSGAHTIKFPMSWEQKCPFSSTRTPRSSPKA